MSHTETARVLEDAAAYIDRNGLHKGAYTARPNDPDSPACAYGAIDAVAVGRVRLRASHALLRAIGPDGESIAAFNDAPSRTAQQVVDAMHSAAKTELRKADEAGEA